MRYYLWCEARYIFIEKLKVFAAVNSSIIGTSASGTKLSTAVLAKKSELDST